MIENKKEILIVLRKSPYGNQTAKESLDAVLTAAAFEQPISLLFMDDGVYQLLENQNTLGIGAKNLSKTLPVLPMYDVEQIYVDGDSLKDRGLDDQSLLTNPVQVDTRMIRELFLKHDQILSF